MLLKIYYKNSDGKKIIKTGHMMLGIGLVCNAIGLLLSRIEHTNSTINFLNGLFIGLGLVLIISASMFIRKGEQKINK